MALSATLMRTLMVDMATGRWSTTTHTIWNQALRQTPGLWPSVTILESLRHDAQRGDWGPTSQRVLAAVLAPISPSVLHTLARDCASGTLSPLARQVLNRL